MLHSTFWQKSCNTALLQQNLRLLGLFWQLFWQFFWILSFHCFYILFMSECEIKVAQPSWHVFCAAFGVFFVLFEWTITVLEHKLSHFSNFTCFLRENNSKIVYVAQTLFTSTIHLIYSVLSVNQYALLRIWSWNACGVFEKIWWNCHFFLRTHHKNYTTEIVKNCVCVGHLLSVQ